jgi:hypothetical protein
MEEERFCIACGLALLGPFEPSATLVRLGSTDDPGDNCSEVSAQSWICRGCGLVHWYVGEAYLDQLAVNNLSEGTLHANADLSYERRTRMLHMLRRVRRI